MLQKYRLRIPVNLAYTLRRAAIKKNPSTQNRNIFKTV